MEIGLYIHIPFCHKICNYCDFPKRVSNLFWMEKYINSLIKEFESRIDIIKKYTIKSIYIGGGTPSSLPNNLLDKLLNWISLNVDYKEIEYTIEANPEDLNIDFIKTIKKYNINRLSIGVQSFNKSVQNVINRGCSYLDLKEKMQNLASFGLNNVNLDYMYGILPLNLEEIKEDLDLLISLNPTHISTYSLILEERTVLYHKYLNNKFNIIDPDLEANTYYYIQDYLNNNDYIQYEISNFSKTGYQSIHNFIYWSNERYLGLGLGASSYLGNVRFKNPSNLKDYLKLDLDNENYYEEVEYLSNVDTEYYQIITNLRTIRGINIKEFNNKFKTDFINKYKVMNLINNKYCLLNNDYFSINPKYLYLSNNIINKIIDMGD